jgi:hypothetical protein
MLRDVENVFLVFHVDGDKFITDLGGMLCVVNQTELLGFDVNLELRIILKFDSLTFDLLAPAILV